MKNTKKITTVKKKAWTEFSKYIRTRDTKPQWPEGRIGACVTCKRSYEFKKLQAGHFIPGRMNSVLFNESIVFAQCYHCNVGLKSNPREYDKFMRTKYTEKEIQSFDKLPYIIKKYIYQDYIDIAQEYKKKTQALLDKENDLS